MNNLEYFKTCRWNKINYSKFIKYLKSLGEVKYREFSSKLIPNNLYEMIGIRIPLQRKIANIIYKNNYHEFLKYATYKYFEEVMICSFIISKIKNVNEQVKYIDKIVPYLNNWSLCDSFVSSMKSIKSDMKFYFNYFSKFNNRISIVVMLNYYLNDEYIDKVFKYIEKVDSKDYYVKMSIAWLLSRAYINYKDKVDKYLNNCDNKDIIYMTRIKIRDSLMIK